MLVSVGQRIRSGQSGSHVCVCVCAPDVLLHLHIRPTPPPIIYFVNFCNPSILFYYWMGRIPRWWCVSTKLLEILQVTPGTDVYEDETTATLWSFKWVMCVWKKKCFFRPLFEKEKNCVWKGFKNGKFHFLLLCSHQILCNRKMRELIFCRHFYFVLIHPHDASHKVWISNKRTDY